MENPLIHATFYVDSKSWFLTWPHCGLTKEEVQSILLSKGRAIKGMVIAREEHLPVTPTDEYWEPFHIHAYILLEKRFCCRNSNFWDLDGHHGHYESAKSLTAVVRYIKKDGDILEYGDLLWASKLEARRDHSAYLGKRLQNESLVSVTDDHPELILRYKNLKESVMAYRYDKIKPLKMTDTRGIWVWGPPRIGKTHWVNFSENSLYHKAQNKWWDGYTGQEAVLIDDLDSDCLSHYLKIWADKWACQGEVKNGHVALNFQRLYVTSNFSIQELFKDLPEVTIEAILGRFKVIHFTDRSMGLDGYTHTNSQRSRSQER